MVRIPCPSEAWDRYYNDQEEPEYCLTCGKENTDENGDWLCKEQPGWCSMSCFNELKKAGPF